MSPLFTALKVVRESDARLLAHLYAESRGAATVIVADRRNEPSERGPDGVTGASLGNWTHRGWDTLETSHGQPEARNASDLVVTVSRPVGGILSSPLRGMGGHPSERSTWERHPREGTGRAARSPGLTLLRVGFTEPAGSPRPLVRSYRTVSPLPVRDPGATPSAVCSLWHCPAGRPDWPLASTLPCGVPTFLDPWPHGGVTSARYGPRPPGRLTVGTMVPHRRPAHRTGRPALADRRHGARTDPVAPGF